MKSGKTIGELLRKGYKNPLARLCIGGAATTCIQSLAYTVLYVISPSFDGLFTPTMEPKISVDSEHLTCVYWSMPLLSQELHFLIYRRNLATMFPVIPRSDYYPTSELLITLIQEFLHSCTSISLCLD
jgi:hypothetical protein